MLLSEIWRRVHALLVLVAVVAVLVLLWEWWAASTDPLTRVVPAPSEIARALGDNADTLRRDARHTLLEAAAGFSIALLAALTLSIVFIRSPAIEELLFGVALTLSSLPLIAIVPILVAWFGNGYAPKIVLAALIGFFPLLVNCTRGLKSVDRETLELMQILGASRTQVLVKVRLYMALPFVLAGARIAAPAAVLGAILAEWVSTQYGLGFRILIALANFNPPLLWATMVVITAVAMTPFALIGAVERRFTRAWGQVDEREY